MPREEDGRLTYDPNNRRTHAYTRRRPPYGHEIGNHSVTHPCTGNYPDFRNNALENYTLQMIVKELDGANAQIEKLLGVKLRTFAYPCGLKFVGKGLDVRSR